MWRNYGLTILESNIKKMDRVSKEQYRVLQEMRRRGIKVFEQHQLEDCITAKYLCRGYTHDVRLLWSKVKSDIEVRLAEYLGVDLGEIQRF
ncbi:hypothetical protein MF628_08255 [Paenibacillus polymyxa]|uniref:hypothetical protein n=1 Tax=Paenibacillus polymyxa TaxID=1406 RepID=UPI0020254667|nr:hypothetical protein [Paenibacillus polymyxa]WDZ64115.1 hypothetical protein MF628_08255 [Paenibacillus polymyxa]